MGVISAELINDLFSQQILISPEMVWILPWQ
jgi:hypothetical protein